MLRVFLVTILSIVFAPQVSLAADISKPSDLESDWTLATNSQELTIYSRTRSGSKLKEFKAVGGIDASSRAVYAVIDDLDAYASFMPYVTECRLIGREGDASLITYQRLSPKICQDRDYTLRVWKQTWAGAEGFVYSNRWEPANELGPAEKKGIVRVKMCEGSWLLEPDGPAKTRATYCVYTDTGGAFPFSSRIVPVRLELEASSPPYASRQKTPSTPIDDTCGIGGNRNREAPRYPSILCLLTNDNSSKSPGSFRLRKNASSAVAT
jgi:hypothetical protein